MLLLGFVVLFLINWFLVSLSTVCLLHFLVLLLLEFMRRFSLMSNFVFFICLMVRFPLLCMLISLLRQFMSISNIS